jgi:acetyl esterase/lipase
VLPRNTRRLAARLRDAGVPVQNKIYPGVDHYRLIGAVSEPLRRVAPVLGDTEAFVRDRLIAAAEDQSPAWVRPGGDRLRPGRPRAAVRGRDA